MLTSKYKKEGLTQEIRSEWVKSGLPFMLIHLLRVEKQAMEASQDF